MNSQNTTNETNVHPQYSIFIIAFATLTLCRLVKNLVTPFPSEKGIYATNYNVLRIMNEQSELYARSKIN